ncbi:MAG: hypothetical protein KAU50_11085 [Candidatus Marinimicrobia bacterium]|nr:hypothetical protein [Candidatus Neomarinimicrobiota bacterium]
MSAKPTKLIGLSVHEFDTLLASGKEIHLQPARLIPFYKPGDEMALTSIFLSALRLIKEFRYQIFQTIGLSRSNQLKIYTEAEFVLFEKKRIDGLVVVIRANKIIDAALLEVKNKNIDLNESQILDYLKIAKEYGIEKLLTISNQFVSFPTQSPLNIKTPKQVSTFHLSWSFILTIAHILLAENENNIEDADQVEIMREIVEYFESTNSGILGFTQMKPGWVELTQKANAGTSLKLSDPFVEDTVSSWLQEERDMALILSRELGLLVQSGQRKFKNNLSARIKYEEKELTTKRRLVSTLQIDGAASPLQIRACFDRKNIEMSSTLSAPLDKKTRGQISWIRNQLRQSERKNPELFATLKPDLIIEINLKFVKDSLRLHLDELDSAIEMIGARKIKSFSILFLKYLGRKFESRKGVVGIIEEMLIDYYQGILQYLRRWEKPAPKIPKKSEQIETT